MKQQCNQQQNRPLRMILPKKGRLKDDFYAVMETAGFKLTNSNGRLDYSQASDQTNKIIPFETLNQRAGDAIDNLNAGLADMAVVGLDRFEEARCQYGNGFNVQIAGRFNLSACALWIAAPETTAINKPDDLKGFRIVTSYPHTLANWLRDNNVKNVTIITREGGIEDYVRLGMADAIFDVVQSGKTLEANKLVKQLKQFDSTAILVERRGEWSQELASQASEITARLLPALNNSAEEIKMPFLAKQPNYSYLPVPIIA